MDCQGTTLAATRRFQSAFQGKAELSQSEKDQLSTDYLFVLAITDCLKLTRHDRARLSPLHVAQLAVTETICLEQEDKTRMPTDLLFNLLIEGLVALTEEELARFTPEQLDYLQNLEPIVSEHSSVESATAQG